MLFSSSIFLFLFLPVVLGLYFLLPNRFKNLLLVISSVIFYTWGEKILVLVMLISTVVDYFAAIVIDSGRRKLGMAMSLITNLSFLAYFKYFNFGFENFYTAVKYLGWDHHLFHNVPYITLPIGISFYTFQTLSYTIDVYRGEVKATRNFIDFAAYVTIFPQLIAGPIVRYIDIHYQLNNKDISTHNFALGVERFVIGLTKKMIIANSCAEVADAVFGMPFSDLSTSWAWMGIVMYSLQIYFDFSAYSDMAIGLGKMLGFHFLENFNYPYISTSIREFWKRWHISLSTWFRDYVYIPLGGNKGSTRRVYLNLFVVFFITGLWHGASWNFIVWGLFHGTFIVAERVGLDKLLQTIWKPFQHLYAILVVLIGWVFFRADDLPQAIAYLSQMISFTSGEPATSSYLSYFFWNPQFIIIGLLAIVLCMPVYQFLTSKEETDSETTMARFCLRLVIGIVMLCTSIAFMAADTYNPFIYFRF